MTIQSQTRTAGPFVGSGAVVPYPFNFKVFQATDLMVVRSNPDGSETMLTMAAEYNVTLNTDQETAPGGIVQLVAGLPSGYSVLITSSIPEIQKVLLTNQGGFYPRVISDALDYLTILIQQLRGPVSRSLKFPISDSGMSATLPSATERANTILGFDSAGRPVVTAPGSESAVGVGLALSSFISNLLSATGSLLVGFQQAGTNAILRTVYAKLRDVQVTFEDFGAVGDGIVNDTTSIRRAIAVSQALNVPVYGVAGKNYKITDELHLVNQTTGAVAKVRGAGRDVCKITPVGTFTAIKSWGLGWGGSGQGAAFSVEFSGFEIVAAGLTGNALDIRRTGLWSKFHDLRINGATGKGMYLQSVFDHSYRDIEIRSCTGYGIHIYESKGIDPDGFQECSQLLFDSVYAIHCNGQDIQWMCEGGDNYTFLHCKPSEGKVGFDFVDNSVGHTLLGTYVDGQTTTPFDNIGIRIGQGCFGISVTGGRYWNVRYAVDFAAGGRSSVSATNVVFDSPIGGGVYDVRLQSGVQQIVDISAGLNVLNQSTFALRQAVDSSAGTYTPVIFADAGQTGFFTYAKQYGEWRITNRVATVKVAIVWSAKPSAGTAFGISLPFAVPTRASHFSIRFRPAVITVPGFDVLGHFQDNGIATKLYFYAGADTTTGANIAEIPSTGALIAEMTFFLD